MFALFFQLSSKVLVSNIPPYIYVGMWVSIYVCMNVWVYIYVFVMKLDSQESLYISSQMSQTYKFYLT